jgi:hypothetical protein
LRLITSSKAVGCSVGRAHSPARGEQRHHQTAEIARRREPR